MTNYCQVNDVEPLLPWPLSTTSTNPNTITEATLTNDIIPEASQYIDDRLRQFYVTPITGTQSLVTMKRICRYLAAAMAIERKYQGQTPSNSPQSTQYRQLAETDLERITGTDKTDPVMLLPDAVQNSDAPESRAHQISDNLSSSLAPTQPIFNTGMTF